MGIFTKVFYITGPNLVTLAKTGFRNKNCTVGHSYGYVAMATSIRFHFRFSNSVAWGRIWRPYQMVVKSKGVAA